MRNDAKQHRRGGCSAAHPGSVRIHTATCVTLTFTLPRALLFFWGAAPRRYDVCALWGVLKARTTKLRVTADEELLLPDASSIFINSTQYFGKGLRGTPLAVWDDGKVDIVALGPKSRGAVLKVFNAIKGIAA